MFQRSATTATQIGVLMLLTGCAAGPISITRNADPAPGPTAAPSAAQRALDRIVPARPLPQAPEAPVVVDQRLMDLQNRAQGPLTTRPQVALMALMQKRDVTGAELITEVVAMRAFMKAQRSPQAVGGLLGRLQPLPGGAKQQLAPADLLVAQALAKADEAIKPYVASISFLALDNHLQSLTDDPELLAREKIRLPDAKGLNPVQIQRVVTMAAIVVATRATGRVLKKAQADFANVENDYVQLIERRDKAARLLYDVLLRGTGSQSELSGLYADQDLQYLRDNVARMSVKDFANDMGAQNLAMRFLQKSDPAAYADYKARSDGTLSSTRGYLRTAGGVVAFGALLATFAQETMAALKGKQSAEVIAAMPFAWEFMKEVPPVLKEAWGAGAAGIVELPMKSNKRFRVIDGAKGEDLSRSKDVFEALRKREAEPLLTESLFRSAGADGLLYKLYRCDRAEAGRLLDVAVPLAEREQFATKYISSDAVRFSFANTFAAPGSSSREQELGDELLRVDRRERSDVVALGEMQRSVARGYGKWNDEQLMRLIFANREGAAALATLQLGSVLVRPIPSMQSVYAYESLIDGCSQQFGGGPKSAAAAEPKSQVVPANLVKPAAQIPAKPAAKVPAKPAVKQP